MLAGRHFKNEDIIKDKIVAGYRQGICDSYGRSVKTADGVFVAKSRPYSSAAKTYIYREGKMVLKE